LGEVAEGEPGGSSAMAYKKNPARAVQVTACVQRVPGLVATVLAGVAAAVRGGGGRWGAAGGPGRRPAPGGAWGGGRPREVWGGGVGGGWGRAGSGRPGWGCIGGRWGACWSVRGCGPRTVFPGWGSWSIGWCGCVGGCRDGGAAVGVQAGRG